MQHYTKDYYAARKERIRSSARAVIPLVLELVQPKSVIDVGCGTGDWLVVFKERGAEDILGVDGEYVSRKMLEIPEERFVPFDLERPFYTDRKFDLVVSLEVAEHLPGKCAETFVGSLTRLGPVVLFSAAIPHQGGERHLNEQWPKYWAELFHDKGYVVIDCLRKKIWNNENVQVWYRQNIIMFVAREHLENQLLLKREYELQDTSQLSIVHPYQYLSKIEEAKLRNRLTSNLRRMVPRKVKRLVRATMARMQV